MRVAQGRFQIGANADAYFLAFLPDLLILRTELGPQRINRASAHASRLIKPFFLILIELIAILFQTLHGWHLRGENLIELWPSELFPIGFQGGHGKIGFRMEEVVETAFLDPCALADVIDADGAVAMLPNEVEGSGEQFFFRIGFLSHAAVYLTDQSNARVMATEPFCLAVIFVFTCRQRFYRIKNSHDRVRRRLPIFSAVERDFQQR